MIGRFWTGWTAPDRAEAYDTLLRTTIFPGILARGIPGLRRIELFRRDGSDEVAFVTLMVFDDMAAVAAFAGTDVDTAVVPPAARALLSRFDATSAHYTIRARHDA